MIQKKKNVDVEGTSADTPANLKSVKLLVFI